jgi:peptidoglycan/xylan/chitin deacetylase (PgdA/CDA1 family)
MTDGTLCLTFDLDGPSSWLARGMTSATPVSRGEYAAVAAPRLLEVLRRRALVSTWFVPAHTVRTWPDLCRDVLAAGHELALHGHAHENVAVLEPDEEADLLRRSIEVFEQELGILPAGFRAPSWDLSEASVGLLVEAGIAYDSSLMGDDHTPYHCRTGDRLGPDRMEWGSQTELVEIPVSWTLDDFPVLEFLKSPTGVLPGVGDPRQMFERWADDLRWMQREVDDGVLTVTCHPEVIGRGHRLLALEGWLDRVTDGVHVATCADVAARFRAGRRLDGRDAQSSIEE